MSARQFWPIFDPSPHWDFLCSDRSNLNLMRWWILVIVSFVGINSDKITILRTKVIKLTWEIILIKMKKSPRRRHYSKKQILKLIYLHYLTLFLTDLVTWHTMRGLIPPSPGRNRVKKGFNKWNASFCRCVTLILARLQSEILNWKSINP